MLPFQCYAAIFRRLSLILSRSITITAWGLVALAPAFNEAAGPGVEARGQGPVPGRGVMLSLMPRPHPLREEEGLVHELKKKTAIYTSIY